MRLFSKHTLALAALAATSPLLFAQASTSSVQLYGIVDVAIRHTNNENGGKDNLTKMIGGGMSQSRWGLNVTEDLGGGLKAIANLENRVNADDGTVSTPFFQQSWVGLQSNSFGRITMGRQYNVLFDQVTSTYASFPYSPYMDAYKPELGMSMGARNNNMLKYTAEFGGLRGALQYSFDEGNKALPTDNFGGLAGIPAYAASKGGAWKSFGGYLRYAQDGFAVAGGGLRTTLPGGTKVDAWTLGGSYRTGGWYFNTGYALNKVKGEFNMTGTGAAGIADQAILSQLWAGQTNGGFQPGQIGTLNHAKKREMYTVGVGYQVTPQLNLGVHYFHAKQSGSTTGDYNGNANFLVAVADYAFSKRTDAYFGVDHTKVSGGARMSIDSLSTATGTPVPAVRSRTGITVGLRHRF